MLSQLRKSKSNHERFRLWRMNTLIVGSGAVGLGLGALLLKAQCGAVSFLARKAGAREVQEEGIFLDGVFGEYHGQSSVFQSFDSPEAVTGFPFDFILVCAKAFDSGVVTELLASHAQWVHPSTKIVLWHNGWGSRDIFIRKLSPDQVYNARIITGFKRTASNRVTITVHAHPVQLGSLSKTAALKGLEPLARALSAAGLPAEVSPAIEKHLWSKMLYNCALNPLGAILGATYGELAASQFAREIMDQVIDEIFAVMAHFGYATFWTDAEGYRSAFYGEMVPPTAAHESSMLQDIRAGRRTEIDFLSGAVVRLARQAGLGVPINAYAYQAISFLEHKTGSTHGSKRGSPSG